MASNAAIVAAKQRISGGVMDLAQRLIGGAVLVLAGMGQALAYENFQVAVYTRAQEVAQMKDPAWLEREWARISAAVHVDKVYLEVHRDGVMPDAATLAAAKAFFAARGIRTAGGITYTISEPNRFETFSYSNPEHRKRVQHIAEFAAQNFDEVILDDFFFTSTKSEFDLQARGNRSWTDYRLQLMSDAGRDLVVRPSRKINPQVKVIIKYPNWYEHFQGLGFNLESGPQIFDGIYTGTETREAVRSAQHLQQYHGYSIMRYFENLAPGRNGGGWVDPYGSRGYPRYAEQLWLTLFAKSGPQVTLFDWRSISQPLAAGSGNNESAAAAAGRAFAAIEPIVGKLGQPVALRSYKPFHSAGEDHLQSFLGMIGLPMEIVPRFPEDDPIVLLTETAAADSRIVDKIEKHVRGGKSVVITSGLLKALQPRGIGRIAEIEHTGRVASFSQFLANNQLSQASKPLLIPQLAYRTNDSWELVSAIDGDNGWPLLHDADYGKGHLFVLTVPENFSDFYSYPAQALNEIRRVLTAQLPVRLEAPSKVSLFAYDNGTFVIHNFRDEPAEVGAVLGGTQAAITDLITGERIATIARNAAARGATPASSLAVARFTVPAHSFRAFAASRAVMPAAKIERWDPAIDAIIPADSRIEQLATGFGWAEGPVWIQNGGYLLFTDVPGNKMWKWSEAGGLEKFLDPSGGVNPDPAVWREAGANGLYPDGPGSILLADTGNRMIARLDLATKQKTPVATKFEGRRFSTPNDVVRMKSGVLFFTDPPYGFRLFDKAPEKEQPFNGVYRMSRDGTVTVIEKNLVRPNGVALSPDERTLYVTQSEPTRAIIMAYALDTKGSVVGSKVFHDATDLVPGAQGLPDGLTVAADGTLFVGAPGGVLVLSKDGKRLGRIVTGKGIANCKFGDDGRTLYLTTSDTLARIRLNVGGATFVKP